MSRLARRAPEIYMTSYTRTGAQYTFCALRVRGRSASWVYARSSLTSDDRREHATVLITATRLSDKLHLKHRRGG